MNVRWFARYGPLRMAIACLLLSAGCGPREYYPHGIRYANQGMEMDVSALSPNCGCLTIRTTKVESRPAGTESAGRPAAPLELSPLTPYATYRIVSSYAGGTIGSVDVKAGDEVSERFDWVGARKESYTLELFGLEEGKDPMALSFWDYTTADATEGPCNETLCGVGPLAMDRLNAGRVGQNQVDARQPGVRFTSDGQLLEVVATSTVGQRGQPGAATAMGERRQSGAAPVIEQRNSCGCMILSNIEPNNQRVTVEVTLNGERTGIAVLHSPAGRKPGEHSSLVIGFDPAGPQPIDRYIMRPVEVGESKVRAQETSASLPPQRSSLPQLSSLVRIVGVFDHLTCTPTGAQVRLPANLIKKDPPATEDPLIECPFEPLKMNKYLQQLQPAEPTSKEVTGSSGTSPAPTAPAQPNGATP